MKSMIATGVGVLLMGAGAAMAEGPRVYAYHSHENFCPAGLQPITISGVICCGQPNQSMSYQKMLAHPVKKVRRVRHKPRRVAKVNCPVGTKGCTYD